MVLFFNVIDLCIGGVMIMGDCGIGKFIMICVLVDLLLDIDVVVGDFYNSLVSDFDL